MMRSKIWLLSFAAILVLSGSDGAFAKPRTTISHPSGSNPAYSKPGAPKMAPNQPASPAAPAAPAPSSAPPAGSSGAYSKPSAATTPAGPAAAQSEADRVVSRKDSQAAFAKLQQQKAAYRQQAEPAVRPAAGSAFGNIQPQPAHQVVIIREHYYGGWGMPAYGFFGPPHFGFWDTMFLYYVLSHATDPYYSSFWYHHYDDPGIAQFRSQIAQQAQDNAELKGQLAQMQTQIDAMQGQTRDPNYLPPSTPPEAALAPSIVTQAPEPESNLASHLLTYALMSTALLGLGAGLFYMLRMRRPRTTW